MSTTSYPVNRPSSIYPTTTPTPNHPSTSTLSHFQPATSIASLNRNRQYTHLHAQLAQLNAHLADMENLLHMTAVQAEYVRGLGGWWGGGFMAASKILGEETANGAAVGTAGERDKTTRKDPKP